MKPFLRVLLTLAVLSSVATSLGAQTIRDVEYAGAAGTSLKAGRSCAGRQGAVSGRDPRAWRREQG